MAYVDQTSAVSDFPIHQFKDYVTVGTSVTVEWQGQSNYAPSSLTVYLQVFNRTSGEWDEVDSESLVGADTDFILTGVVSGLSDYLDGNNILSCRVYQAKT